MACCVRISRSLYSKVYHEMHGMVILKERRAFLRWLYGAGAGGISLAIIGPIASHAQHHQNAGAQISQDGAATLVFAAATLKPALDEIVRAFEAAGGAKVNVAYGPSPILAKNVADGAPADIFFSADTLWMDYLAELSLIRTETRVDIVRNAVVLVQGREGQKREAVIVDSSFPIAEVVGAGPIAMCNPESHPAGRYGRLRLQQLRLWDAISSKVAIVDNPQVAALMVGRGDATAAVVFATDIHGIGGAHIAGTFADQAQSPIAYPAAVTADAHHLEKARHLLMYLRSPEARKIFEGYGYR
jgi:molybdate transport system substrate-binding protein